MRADVVDAVDAVGVRVLARALVADDRVVLPRVPQGGDHVEELVGPFVPVGVRRVLVETEVLRRAGRARRDDVPARSSAADVVEAGELAGQVVRLGVRGGRRADQAQVGGRRGQGGQQRERLEPEPRRVGDVVRERRAVREEQAVERGGLRGPGQLDVVREVEHALGRRLPVPPGCLVVTARVHEQVEVQLPGHRTATSVRASGVRVRRARQAVVLAQGGAGVLGAEQPALEQDRHHVVDERPPGPTAAPAGMMLNPSAAPWSNQSWIASATCSGVPVKVRCPRPPPSRPISWRTVRCSRRARLTISV